MNRLMTIILFAALPAAAQVALPPLTVSDTRVESAVTYDVSRGVYRYEYTVVTPLTNRADVRGIQIDVSGMTTHDQHDPSLVGNAIVPKQPVHPATTIPVGITVPDPAWLAMLNVRGSVALAPGRSAFRFARGTRVGGIVIESRFPPNVRPVVVIPDSSSWEAFANQYPEGTDFTPATSEIYRFTTSALAPFEPGDADLYDGGGQQPADVNKFLRYAQPKDNRVKLPAGSTSTTVIVYYGKTIDPASFNATLNGADVTSRFHPIAGAAEAIVIPIQGSTRLHLEVNALKTSGSTGRDADTLTFLP